MFMYDDYDINWDEYYDMSRLRDNERGLGDTLHSASLNAYDEFDPDFWEKYLQRRERAAAMRPRQAGGGGNGLLRALGPFGYEDFDPFYQARVEEARNSVDPSVFGAPRYGTIPYDDFDPDFADKLLEAKYYGRPLPSGEVGVVDAMRFAMHNSGQSAMGVAGAIGEAMSHPIDTLENLLETGIGTGQAIMDWDGGSRQAAQKAHKYIVDRYGSWRAFKDTFSIDPVGTAADGATAFGAASNALGMGSSALREAGAVSLADTLSSLDRGIGTVGTWIDPLTPPTVGIGKSAGWMAATSPYLAEKLPMKAEHLSTLGNAARQSASIGGTVQTIMGSASPAQPPQEPGAPFMDRVWSSLYSPPKHDMTRPPFPMPELPPPPETPNFFGQPPSPFRTIPEEFYPQSLPTPSSTFPFPFDYSEYGGLKDRFPRGILDLF